MGKYLPIIMTARCGSLNKAAAELGYTQPSLWYIINNMENDLGVKLFDRTRRGVTLTEAGKRLVEEMERIEAREEQLYQIAQSCQGSLIRVGIFPSRWGVSASGSWWYTNLVNRWQECEVQFIEPASYREGLEAVRGGTLDCCISVLEEAPGVDCIPLGEYPHHLILSAREPLAQRDQVTLSDVVGNVRLIPSKGCFDPDSPLYEIFHGNDYLFMADSVPPDCLTALGLAAQGAGALILPESRLGELPIDDSLRVLPITDCPRRTDTLLCLKKSERTPVLDRFIDFMLQSEQERKRRFPGEAPEKDGKREGEISKAATQV